MKVLTIILIFFIFSACSTSRGTLLTKQVFYNRSVDKNYSKLGKCINDQFPAPKKTNSVTFASANGLLIPVNTSQINGFDGFDDQNAKEYYINDYLNAGLSSISNWIIVIKSANEEDTKSDIEIRSKKTISGKARFNLTDMENKINNCI